MGINDIVSKHIIKKNQKATEVNMKYNQSCIPLYLTPKTPIVFTLELTSACNHNCVGCGNVFPYKNKWLSEFDWEWILDKIKPYAESLRITGGECSLHPNFYNIIKHIDRLEIPYVIFSNGNWEFPHKTVEFFKSCRFFDGLLISLHGCSAKSHEAYVSTNTFDNVVKNIKLVVKNGINVGTNTVLNKHNINEIYNIISFAKNLGVSSIAFSRFYGAPIHGFELHESEIKSALNIIMDEHEQDESIIINNCVPVCFTGRNISTKGCTSGFTHCTIDPTGIVRPCTHSQYKLGSIFQQSVEEIWASKKLKKWRNLVPLECLECASFDDCRGGCRANAIQRGLKEDPLMKGPIHQLEYNEFENVEIYRYACPHSAFKVRRENFGFFLINRGCHLAVKYDALPIIEAIDGNTTMDEIFTKFGQVGIDFIGNLAYEGLVDIY